MKLLGDWNWYLPSWLEWLPRIGPDDAASPPGRSEPDEPSAGEARPVPA